MGLQVNQIQGLEMGSVVLKRGNTFIFSFFAIFVIYLFFCFANDCFVSRHVMQCEPMRLKLQLLAT